LVLRTTETVGPGAAIVYVAFPTALCVNPLATAMASIVVVVDTETGEVEENSVEAVEGVVPLVV
jgi:hypothetical protein